MERSLFGRIVPIFIAFAQRESYVQMKMKQLANSLRAISFSILFSGILASCAYRMAGDNNQFVGGYKSVSIPVFKNRSTEPKIEVFFTNALRRELQRDGIAQVTQKELSPITIEGSIDSVRYVPVGTVRPATLPENARLAAEYRIYIAATLQVRRNADDRVLWNGSVSNERSYLAPQIGTETVNSANALYNQSARLQNIEIMAKDMMTEAYNRMTENF